MLGATRTSGAEAPSGRAHVRPTADVAPEQFAQRTFAEETERVTEGAAGWQDPPEIRLGKVQGDSVLGPMKRTGKPRWAPLLPAKWYPTSAVATDSNRP
jgi:hypothetical protein